MHHGFAKAPTIEQMASVLSQRICNTPPSSYRFSRSVSGFLPKWKSHVLAIKLQDKLGLHTFR
jgi:hypothetical protein